MKKNELENRIKELEFELSDLKSEVIAGKQAETNLAELHQFHSQIINSIQEGIIVYDSNLRHTVWNPYMEKLSGIPASEVLGKYPTEVFPFLEEVGVVKNLKRALNGENTDAIDFPFSLPDSGISGWASDKNMSLRDVNGEIIGVIGTVHNITVRKRAELALKESESSLRNAQEIAKMGSWELDLNNQKTKWSENCFVIYGLKPFEIEPTFEYFKSRIHPDDLHLVVEAFETTIRHKVPYTSELRIIFPDGTFRWFQNRMIPIFQDDKPVALKGINLDITERKLAEELLAKERTRYQELADSISDVFFAMDKNLRYTYWNKASENLTGISAENAIGKSLMEIFPDNEARQQVKDFYLQVIESKKPNQLTVNYPGSIHLIHEISAYPIIDGVSIFIKDITERRQAEMNLAESHQFYSQIINCLEEGIIVYDHNLKYKIWNPFMEELSGIPASQVIGKYPTELFPFLEEAGVIENLKKTLNGDVMDSIDFPFHIPDTEKSGWTSDKNMPIRDVNGEIIGVIGTVHNITDRKRAEQTIKDSERKLLQLNTDKDRFITILSHDLKSPFNNLLGLSEILTEDIRKLDIAEIEDIANNINKSARITYNLLEDILMWARTQQGKIPFKPQNLSFADICKDILEILSPISDAKNIVINYTPLNEITVFADIDMLKTILRNLVSNAIKFTNNGGSININAEENSGNITITVSDNGIGIEPDNLIKLFDITEVLTTKGTAEETGTGLGLLLCRGFVEKHKGKIWVESEVGKGSDFKFTMPIFTEQANAVNN
jgi:PAS domain S-box-containing protein